MPPKFQVKISSVGKKIKLKNIKNQIVKTIPPEQTFSSKVKNEFSINFGLKTIKKGSFIEVFESQANKVEKEYGRKFYVEEYDVEKKGKGSVEEESQEGRYGGQHNIIGIPYLKVVKGKEVINLKSSPRTVIRVFNKKGKKRIKKINMDKKAKIFKKSIKKSKKKKKTSKTTAPTGHRGGKRKSRRKRRKSRKKKRSRRRRRKKR